MTVDELVAQLEYFQRDGNGGATVVVETGHGCCDPLSINGGMLFIPADSLAGPAFRGHGDLVQLIAREGYQP